MMEITRAKFKAFFGVVYSAVKRKQRERRKSPIKTASFFPYWVCRAGKPLRRGESSITSSWISVAMCSISRAAARL
jgi:hypothetical protein